jgi:Raf kinase inhibitor-like YbhB/YbcL family protein
MAFTLSSPAFRDGQEIPRAFTCQGGDRSPALSWSGTPPAARFLALVLDDPDAPRGTWTHWTWWDLPATVPSLPEGADVGRLGAVQGTTSARATGYHGPCPPSGRHRYVFTLHALAEPLRLPAGASVSDLQAALKAKSVGKAQLRGTYQQS